MKMIGKNRAAIVRTFAVGWVLVSLGALFVGWQTDNLVGAAGIVTGITGSITTYAAMATSSNDETPPDRAGGE